MTTKKTKKVSPSKIFNSAINWLNTYLEIVAGGNIKTQRRRLVWLIPVSLLSPFVGILLAWIAKIIWLSTISPLFIILFFTIAIVPWLFLLWLTVALYIPLILLTIPADYSEKLKELNASPENAKKLARFFSDIIAWVLFAGLYCFFFKIWHNILAVVPLLVVVLYFIFATSGKWIEPDPKFKQKLFKAVTFLIFIPLTLSFISPTFYYHIFGSSLSTLSNKYPESQMTNEKLDKTIKKALDKKLAKELQEINDEIKKGKITPEDAEKKQGEIKKKFKNESLLKKTTHGVGNGIKSGIEKVKNIWSSKKPDSNINSKMLEKNTSTYTPPQQESLPIPRDWLIKTSGRIVINPNSIIQTDLYFGPKDEITYTKLSSGKFRIINEKGHGLIINQPEIRTRATHWGEIQLEGLSKKRFTVNISIERNCI